MTFPLPIQILARYRDNATGEIREEQSDCNAGDGGKPDPFWWSDGNAACDCNRALLFHRIGGVELGEGENPCGDSAYDVQLVGPDGVFYDEFEEPVALKNLSL